ncbi:MAG: sigma 54-interacting transcriptional regulator [Acidobacteria bacterium]|nr:sigma 54-interacting transcriptional regulator [Acidobacteriota bacterium]
MAGPLVGRAIPVPADGVVLGRDSTCNVPIHDSAISRRHAAVLPSGSGTLLLRDLDSRNGTFLNAVPVRECVLTPGDEISLGKSVFIYQSTDATADKEPTSDRTIAPSSQMRWLSRSDREKEEARGRTARELEALLAISKALQGERGIEPVARRLLLAMRDSMPLESAAILLFFDGLTEPPWSLALEGDPPLFETALLEEVIGAERAAAWDRLLAAPIIGSSKAFGVLWAEGASFDADHLRLAGAAGAIGGLALEAARRFEEAEQENRRLRQQLIARHDMVGDSTPMQAVYRFIARVAALPSTVLILGESGTGKELVAQAIHRNSTRADKPFVAINCASLSENLLESELFGHEKGAFTGAVAQKRGKLEVANGGTVFLDELGEMPMPTQAKVLRVLQQREMERLGGTRTIPLDIRIIAATNADLSQAVRDRRFREDLYYRINVVSIEMPPLRKRLADVPLLAAYFVSRYARQMGRRTDGVSPEVKARLLHYDWPGNVRELQNAMERAVVMGVSEHVLPEDLPEALLERTTPGAPHSGYHEALQEKKKQLILEALAAADGSVTAAAASLGLHPNYLHRLMSNLELR